MDDRIVIAHGGGGSLTWELLEKTILPAFGQNPAGLTDAAPIPGADSLAFTTDSFVVKPLFFPGGDIGSLSVYGTLNDLAVSGAEPLALSMSLVIEEGFEIKTLRQVLDSAAAAAKEAGIQIITGDTKVVPRGEADGLFITTAGVGRRVAQPAPSRIAQGDRVILSGGIAEHGMAVLSAREGLAFETQIESDATSVWPMVRALLDAGIEPHAMRDPTRGGLAACCVELAASAASSVILDEAAIPIRPEVVAACELLGLDPLAVANEGKLVAFVAGADADKALAALRNSEKGKHAAMIGVVVAAREKPVFLRTRYGGERIVEMPYGETLPRIC
ncbi:MAG TPA: hydrogenase expression/formation protein HypE [Candidatus Hydrogenedentes bacterium]|nr:hydrogenase expression/formation protein HypE [Candidatus Hydrogenedentota bacterium]